MKIQWDESESRTLRPGVCSVSASREEISLLFAADAPLTQKDHEAVIPVSDRVVLSPRLAKKLAVLLEQTLRKYEPVTHPFSPSPDPGSLIHRNYDGEKNANQLLQLVNDLGVGYEFERSLKIIPGKILANRFLLGVGKKSLLENADAQLIELCRRMGMPENMVVIFESRLADANFVHFGFEEEEGECLYKVYLEFLDRIRHEIGGNRDDSVPRLLHLSFKWNVTDNTKQAITSYTLYPWLSAQEMISRAGNALTRKNREAAAGVLEDIVRLALWKAVPDDLLYLEVAEEGNPRKSFDLNMYRAELAVAELYPFLSRIARSYKVSYKEFHALYDHMKTGKFGHLAGGTDRQGRTFFTFYYGSRGMSGGRRHNEEEARTVRRQSVAAPGNMDFQLVEKKDESAIHLLQLVNGIQADAALEHSCKFLPGILLADRFLTSIKRSPENAAENESILNLCKLINMPPDFQERFRVELPTAGFVLFGFENNEKSRVYKAYLEFSSRLEEALRQEPRPENVVVYSGFKWDICDPSKRLLAEYRALPLFRAADIAARISARFYADMVKSPFHIVDDFIDLAGTRSRPGELMYFEVSEEENMRRSFDLNMYYAGLTLSELYPLLVKMAQYYSIEQKHFDQFYNGVKNQKFGHISGGIDREGRDFLTIYFSEKGSTRNR